MEVMVGLVGESFLFSKRCWIGTATVSCVGGFGIHSIIYSFQLNRLHQNQNARTSDETIYVNGTQLIYNFFNS